MSKIAYKLCRIKKKSPGQIFPLYVLNNEAIPIGEWSKAKVGPLQKNGKVKASLGKGLAFRPGYHLCDLPLAIHIGEKENGKISYLQKDRVWCKCEYSSDIDYSLAAKQNGYDENGKYHTNHAYLKYVPVNGYYRFKTNPNMLGDFIIAGEVKVLQVLSDEEVEKICKENGHEAMPRKEKLNLSDYGFVEGAVS